MCGDGVIEGDEACDDSGESAMCNADCTVADCGDGILNMTAGEACDDSGESATCNADCTAAECGDGILNMTAGEACDDSGESAECNSDCTVADCGDGVVNMTAGEECDDAGESVECDADCTASECGDGVTNMTAGEACDDSGESAMCDVDCSPAECTDGQVNMTAGEDCDDGNMVDDDACPNDCNLNVSATCADILTNANVWGMQASGVNLVDWTSSTLHYIGCPLDGCPPNTFYCNYDPVAETLQFGTTNPSGDMRGAVDPGDLLGDALPNAGQYNGCCQAPMGLCNAPNSANNGVGVNMVDALCTALGYSTGQIVREANQNGCPQVHVESADGQDWNTDFAFGQGDGSEYLCSDPL